MKKTLILFLLIYSFNSYSQNVQFLGTVDNWIKSRNKFSVDSSLLLPQDTLVSAANGSLANKNGLWIKKSNVWTKVVPDSLLGGAQSCIWPNETTLGTIYSKSTWSNNSDFTTHGAIAATLTSGFINLTGGNPLFADYVTIGGPTNLNKWHMHSLVKVISESGSSGIGFGLRWGNTNSKFDFLGSFGLNTNTANKVYLPLIGASPVIYDSSAINLSYSVNDIIEVDVDFNINVATVTVHNTTTGGPNIIVGKTWLTPALGAGMPNTCNFAIYSYGGTQQIRELDITSNAVKNASVLIVGDSKTQGFYADNWSTTFSNLVSTTYPTTTFRAGEGDGVQQTLSGITELLSLHPQQVIMNIGSNDYRAGRSTSQIIADYNSVVTQLQAAGITVYHIVMPEDSTAGGVGMTALKNYIAATYGVKYINQVWDTLSTSNVLKSAFQHDPVHTNQLGNNAIAVAIISSGKLTVCTDRTTKIISNGLPGYLSKFNINNTVDNSGLYQVSGRYGINTTTPSALFDIAQNTQTSNTLQVGAYGVESIDFGNWFMSNNSYFNGSKTVFRSNKPTSIFQMIDSSILFYNTPMGTKDSSIIPTLLMKIGRNFSAADAPLSFGLNTVNTFPFLGMSNSAASFNNKNWDEYIDANKKHYRVISDDATAGLDWLTVNRNGTGVDSVNFPNSQVIVSGLVKTNSGLTINSTNGFPFNMNSTGSSSYMNLNNITSSPNIGITMKYNGVTKWTLAAYANRFSFYNNVYGDDALFFDTLSNKGTFRTGANYASAHAISGLDLVYKQHLDTIVNAIVAGGLPTQTGNSGKVLATNGTTASWTSIAGSGTVTSVAVTAPTGLSISGSPVTGSGTIGITTSLNGWIKGNGSGFITASPDTIDIASFSAKVRSLFAAGTGTTYNASTGAFSATNSGTVTTVGFTSVPTGLSASVSNNTTTPSITISSSLASNQVVIGAGGGFTTVATGTNGYYLKYLSGVPVWSNDAAALTLDSTLQAPSNVTGVNVTKLNAVNKSTYVTTSTYTVASDISFVVCNYGAGTCTVTLPDPAANIDRVITVKDWSANNVSISGVRSTETNTLTTNAALTFQAVNGSGTPVWTVKSNN